MKKLLNAILITLSFSSASIAGVVTLDAAGAISLVSKSRLEATFYNYDESFLWKTDFDYGDSITYKGPIPTKEEDEDSKYTFVSWDKSLNGLTETQSFYAQFKKEGRDYKCTFKNFNGLELYVDFVPAGGTAKYYGIAPSRPKDDYNSYRFTGWDNSLDNIREDTVFIAQYEEAPLQYEVTFLDYNGDFLYKDEVDAGGTAQYVGIIPVRPSANFIDYEFSGWDKDLNNVFSNFETKAVYAEYPIRYKVIFTNYDGTELFIDYVSNGGTAHYIGPTPYRPADERFEYVFDSWNKDLRGIHNDMIVGPTFTKKDRDYLVVFKDGDGTTLYQTSATYNTCAKYIGDEPTKESDVKYDYTFIGWDRDVDHVTSDLEVYPVFKQTLRKYDCHFFNFDDSFIKTVKCEYGKTVHYDGDTPFKPPVGTIAFKFYGWDRPLENITSETIFHAVFVEDDSESATTEPLKVVAYYDYCLEPRSKDILDLDIVVKGEISVFDKTNGYPQHSHDKPGTYTFVGWDKPIWLNSMPDFSFNVYPQYTYNYQSKTYYIVTYRNNNGDILYEDYVLPNGKSVYKGPNVASISPSNYFVGWANYIYWDQESQLNKTDHIYNLDKITESITVFPMHNR